jgi:3D (Asp-Asp-Asp) domain-containing protein
MMKKLPTFIVVLAMIFMAGCAQNQKNARAKSAKAGATKTVRTTAYTAHEPGGPRNAVGQRLQMAPVNSAASDWSRFPLGTKFQIVQTGKMYQIDDYGSALVGTNTIDLFHFSNRDMRNWGVRYVDIRILEWGSPERSLAVLEPRTRNGHVRQMVAALRTQARHGGG